MANIINFGGKKIFHDHLVFIELVDKRNIKIGVSESWIKIEEKCDSAIEAIIRFEGLIKKIKEEKDFSLCRLTDHCFIVADRISFFVLNGIDDNHPEFLLEIYFISGDKVSLPFNNSDTMISRMEVLLIEAEIRLPIACSGIVIDSSCIIDYEIFEKDGREEFELELLGGIKIDSSFCADLEELNDFYAQLKYLFCAK